MISKKSIIVLFSVVLLLAGAFLCLSLFDTEEEKPVSFDGESIELFTTTADNIVRMELTVDGESFAFARTEDDWVMVGDEDLKLRYSYVDFLCSELSGVYAKQCIDEKGEDLSIYGFDAPLATYKIIMADGSTKTFLLGNRDVITGQYYFKLADTAPVYTIYPTKGDSIYKKKNEYWDLAIVDVNMEKLSSIRVKSSNINLELVREKKDDVLVWNMKQPMVRSTDNEQVNKNLISKLSYITVDKLVEKGSEAYAESGVNNPRAVLTLADDAGTTQVFYIGREKDMQRYIRTNGRVYLINADSMSFIDTDPFIYVNKFIHLENITGVNKVEVTGKDKTYTATINGSGDAAVYKFNGTQILESNFKKDVYQKIIGLMADGFAENPKYGPAEYTVVFYMNDGRVKKTEYCAYDDRNFAAYGEDGCEFIIRRKKLEEMFSALGNVIVARDNE